MRLRNLFKFSWVSLVAGLALVFVGCADTSWESARRTNTVASYHQFLRDHPGSPKSEEAQERIAYLRVLARPTIESVQEFENEFPRSELIAELRAEVEPLYFERARMENTPEAYREFLALFPDGRHTEQARGNLTWIEGVRDETSPGRLREFVASYESSDFAAEAQRSLELLEARRLTTFRTLGVRVDVAANVDEAERVARGFSGLAAAAYRDLGVEVTLLPPGSAAPPDLDAWLRIDYAEVPASGTFGRGSLVSDCRVRLYHRDEGEPVWDRRFQAPAQHLTKAARSRDKTIFGNGRYAFWDQFFVPTSTWATSRARVHQMSYDEPVAAVDTLGDRAAVLLQSGTTDYLDVASPLSPTMIQRYRRIRDLARFSGIRLLPGDRAALFGPNGLELVAFEPQAARRLGRWETSEIGAVEAVETYDETLLVAGSKGLFALRFNRDPLTPHRLLDGDWVGIARWQDDVWLVAPDQLAVAKPEQLLRHVTGARTPFRSTFRAQRARLLRDSLWVFSANQAVQFALDADSAPRPVAELETGSFGAIRDVASDGGHLYLLGDRGLQIASPSGGWVSDVIQVSADQTMAAKGRFLLLGGGQSFEVVDLSPYRVSLASPED